MKQTRGTREGRLYQNHPQVSGATMDCRSPNDTSNQEQKTSNFHISLIIGYRLPHHNNIEHDYNFQDRVLPLPKGLSRSGKTFQRSRITSLSSASNCARVQLYSSSIDSRSLIPTNPATTSRASQDVSIFCKWPQ